MTTQVCTQHAINGLKHDLIDSNVAIEKKFRSLFTLRGISTKEAIDAMSCALNDPSALLRHEVAYCLGQMGDAYAFPILCKVLAKTEEHPMVRHEVVIHEFIVGSRGHWGAYPP